MELAAGVREFRQRGATGLLLSRVALTNQAE
jgi:hypothetical protein